MDTSKWSIGYISLIWQKTTDNNNLATTMGLALFSLTKSLCLPIVLHDSGIMLASCHVYSRPSSIFKIKALSVL